MDMNLLMKATKEQKRALWWIRVRDFAANRALRHHERSRALIARHQEANALNQRM